MRCAPCDANSSRSSFLTTQLKRRFRDQTLSLTHSSSQKSFSTFYDWTSIRVIKELSMNGMASTLWAANNLCNQKYVAADQLNFEFFFFGKCHCVEVFSPKSLEHACQPQYQLFTLTTSRKLKYEGRPNWHHLIIITPRQQSTLNPFSVASNCSD